MKAIIYKAYGGPEVLSQSEVEKKAPKANEVQVKIKAISINPAEWHALRATLFIVRLSTGLRKPKNQILGGDISGEITAVGSAVKNFKVGDQILGRAKDSALAEFCCITKDRICLKPDHLTHEAAAALPLVSVCALQGLKEGKIKAGQKVLINGASGGIGTIAVQLAKYFGAEVTGVCSTPNIELVRSLGADHVIDYTQEDFTKTGIQYDLILDNIGNKKAKDLKKVMVPKGECVILGFSSMNTLVQGLLVGKWIGLKTKKNIRLFHVEVTGQDLEFMAKLVSEGKIKPVIDRSFSFNDTAKAFEYLGTKRARGKVLINLA